MVMSDGLAALPHSSGKSELNGQRLAAAAALVPQVIWHDLECGLYRADLPVWRELARACPDGPILDVGAGTGRVTLELARERRRVIALDRDPLLLAALSDRATGLDVRTVCADACTFELPERGELALCVVPMQTVQLLGEQGRRDFLRVARAHLRSGGLLACSIVTTLEPFDCTAGGPRPQPETARIDGTLYASQATRVEVGGKVVVIERERTTSKSATVEQNLIELDRVSAHELEREGEAAGLQVEAALFIAPTDEHTGSTVVVLRA